MTPEQQQRRDELMGTKMSRWPKGLVRYIEQRQRQQDLESMTGDTLATRVEEWVRRGEPEEWVRTDEPS